MTRGINRFKGLSLALSEINDKYTEIEGVSVLVYWAENSKELSNNALKTAIENNPDANILKKALITL